MNVFSGRNPVLIETHNDRKKDMSVTPTALVRQVSYLIEQIIAVRKKLAVTRTGPIDIRPAPRKPARFRLEEDGKLVHMPSRLAATLRHISAADLELIQRELSSYHDRITQR